MSVYMTTNDPLKSCKTSRRRPYASKSSLGHKTYEESTGVGSPMEEPHRSTAGYTKGFSVLNGPKVSYFHRRKPPISLAYCLTYCLRVIYFRAIQRNPSKSAVRYFSACESKSAIASWGRNARYKKAPARMIFRVKVFNLTFDD